MNVPLAGKAARGPARAVLASSSKRLIASPEGVTRWSAALKAEAASATDADCAQIARRAWQARTSWLGQNSGGAR